MSNVDIRAIFRALIQLKIVNAQVFTNYVVSQANLGVGPQGNRNASTPGYTTWVFMRMNPPTFHVTKVDKIHKAS